MDIRKSFLTKRVVKDWNNLPREVVQSPSVEVLKRYVDVILGDMFSSELGSSRLMLELNNIKGLFQDEQFYGSMKRLKYAIFFQIHNFYGGKKHT